MTTCGAAIKNFEAKTGESAAEAKIVKLYCQVPPIAKMDGSLNNLAACEHLQLSTNAIDKFGVALSLPNLKILSVGRNVIKKFDKLDDLGDNLEVRSRRPTSVPSLQYESSPGVMDVGGLFFEFGAVRTVSSEYDAPRRSSGARTTRSSPWMGCPT